jgi:LysM repeat protein
MIYTIKEGDTLSELAVRFGTTTKALAEMNHISDPDKIYVGHTLIVPGTGIDIPDSVDKVLQFDWWQAFKKFFGM